MVPVKTGSSSRRGAFALIAFTLGGSVMLMASQPHGSTVRAGSGITSSALTTKCQTFWGSSDIDMKASDVGHGNETPTGAVINLYSSVSAKTKRLTFAWQVVGGLENTSGTDTRIYGKKLGHRNPANPPEGNGCILFKRTFTGYAASFHQRAGGASTLESVLVCPTHRGTVPIWNNVPVGCDTLRLTIGNVSITLRIPPERPFVTESTALTDQLAKKFTKPEVAAILRLLNAEGAWYPCDSNGCCRAS
jgi:hypothetical protein